MGEDIQVLFVDDTGSPGGIQLILANENTSLRRARCLDSTARAAGICLRHQTLRVDGSHEDSWLETAFIWCWQAGTICACPIPSGEISLAEKLGIHNSFTL